MIFVLYHSLIVRLALRVSIFFFKYTATTEIYTLSLHDALPISSSTSSWRTAGTRSRPRRTPSSSTSCAARGDRKSTRLNSSHVKISYAVFCLKKKKKHKKTKLQERTIA